MHSQESPLDPAGCLYIVTRYLQAQGWQLVAPQELARQIWPDLEKRDLRAKAATKQVETQAWQRYAEILHAYCCQPGGELYEQAWSELRTWLQRQIRYLQPEPHEPEVVIQEVLADLHRRLCKSPLKTPRALWAFVLQGMKNKNRDLFRRRTANIRGGGNELYLEEITKQFEGEAYDPEERLMAGDAQQRETESRVADEELSEQLREFFRRYLPTTFQQQVAEASFVDGLSPKEIAQLMSKQAHEIRLAKARVVQALRALPPEEKEQLQAILGSVLNPEQGADDD